MAYQMENNISFLCENLRLRVFVAKRVKLNSYPAFLKIAIWNFYHWVVFSQLED